MGVVAECALAGGLDRGTAGDRYQVVVHLDADALADEPDVPAGTCQGDASDRVRVAAGGNCRSAAGQSVRRRGGCSSYTTGAHSQTVLEEAGGIHVSPETARRLSCDAAMVKMQHGAGGQILDVGRRTRMISPALRGGGRAVRTAGRAAVAGGAGSTGLGR